MAESRVLTAGRSPLGLRWTGIWAARSGLELSLLGWEPHSPPAKQNKTTPYPRKPGLHALTVNRIDNTLRTTPSKRGLVRYLYSDGRQFPLGLADDKLLWDEPAAQGVILVLSRGGGGGGDGGAEGGDRGDDGGVVGGRGSGGDVTRGRDGGHRGWRGDGGGGDVGDGGAQSEARDGGGERGHEGGDGHGGRDGGRGRGQGALSQSAGADATEAVGGVAASGLAVGVAGVLLLLQVGVLGRLGAALQRDGDQRLAGGARGDRGSLPTDCSWKTKDGNGWVDAGALCCLDCSRPCQRART